MNDISKTTTPVEQNDIQENKLLAAIGYVICLAPLLLKTDSKYAQFHGKQGLVLTVAAVLWWLAGFVFGWIPFLGWLVMIIGWLAIAVFIILGIVHALSGHYWDMPFLGKYAKEIKL